MRSDLRRRGTRLPCTTAIDRLSDRAAPLPHEKGKAWLVAGVDGIKGGEEPISDYGSGYYPRKGQAHGVRGRETPPPDAPNELAPHVAFEDSVGASNGANSWRVFLPPLRAEGSALVTGGGKRLRLGRLKRTRFSGAQRRAWRGRTLRRARRIASPCVAGRACDAKSGEDGTPRA